MEGVLLLKQRKKLKSKNICIGTGVSPKIPAFAKLYINSKFFHIHSKVRKNLSVHEKRVAIIGGGQTGVEVFRNTLREKWGKAKLVKLVSSRPNLQTLDESILLMNILVLIM
jgi:lysine N6-hydroxylase